jgi:hypothetical protein
MRNVVYVFTYQAVDDVGSPYVFAFDDRGKALDFVNWLLLEIWGEEIDDYLKGGGLTRPNDPEDLLDAIYAWCNDKDMYMGFELHELPLNPSKETYKNPHLGIFGS